MAKDNSGLTTSNADITPCALVALVITALHQQTEKAMFINSCSFQLWGFRKSNNGFNGTKSDLPSSPLLFIAHGQGKVFKIYLPNLSLLLKSAPLLNSKLRHSTFLQRDNRKLRKHSVQLNNKETMINQEYWVCLNKHFWLDVLSRMVPLGSMMGALLKDLHLVSTRNP